MNETKKLIVGITAPGSVILLEGQLRYFREKGYETFLMAPRDPRVLDFCSLEKCKLLEVSIKRDISPLFDILTFLQIARHFFIHKPDVINVGTSKMGFLGIIAGRLTGVKCRIYTARGLRFEAEQSIKKRILIYALKIVGRFSSKIVYISNSVKKNGIREGVFPDYKCIVINKGSSNGINLQAFKKGCVSDDDILKARLDLGINHDFVFGFIGRLNDRKGINELFAAFDRLHKEYDNIRLVITGTAEHNRIKDKTLLPRMEEHPGIIFTGFQKDIKRIFSVLDVFVLPSYSEGFGNVLIQAAAMGLPVISSTSTGTEDAVCQNYNGILVKPGSTEDLYLAMSSILLDKNLHRYLANNGPQWAANFENSIIWEGLESVYKDSCN